MDSRQIAENVAAKLSTMLELDGVEAEAGSKYSDGSCKVYVRWTPKARRSESFGWPSFPGEMGRRDVGYTNLMVDAHGQVSLCGWFPRGIESVTKALRAEGITVCV